MKLLTCAVMLLTLGLGAHAKAAEIVTNKTVGFEIVKPDGWQHLTAEANAANLRAIEMEDKNLQEAIIKYGNAPVVAFTKYAEPYPDVNPSFKIGLRAAGQLAGRDAKDVLAVVLPVLEKALADVAVQEGPVETSVAGLPAAYVRMTYTMSAGGAQFPTTSEIWVVPRGSFFFLIGAGTRQDEANGTRAEIRAILESMKIDPQP